MCVGGRICSGIIPPSGTLGRDRRVVLATDLTWGEADDSQAVVTCMWGDYLLAWDERGNNRRVQLRVGPSPSPFDVYAKFYGESARGLDDVPFRLEVENI